MPGIVLAWLFGEGLLIYRSFKQDGQPPVPGRLLASSGLFAALGLLADAAPQARFLAAAMAWGFDVAAFMNLSQVAPLTGGTAGTTKAAPAASTGGKA